MNQKVFVTRSIPYVSRKLRGSMKSASIVEFRRESVAIPRAELLESVKGCHGIFCLLTDKIDKEVLDSAGPDLKVVSTMSVGYNHIDVEECHRRGIQVGYTPGVLTEATAELAVALTINVQRKLFESALRARDGQWGVWKPFEYCGSGISGSTVGIVGMGRIGTAYARMMKTGFNCRILYASRSRKAKIEEELDAEYCSDFNGMLSRSDIVSIHCPLSPETTGLMDLQAFKSMPSRGILINTSRGEVVNQDDLATALQSGQIAGAGLDVTTPEPLPPNHPLFSLPNCLILPHVGSATVKTRENMADLAIENLLAGICGKKIPHGV